MSTRRHRWCVGLAVAGLLALVVLGTWLRPQPQPKPPLLLAPMMDLDGCLFAHRSDVSMPDELRRSCMDTGSSAHLIDSTLAPYAGLARAGRVDAPIRLGFTLKVPLLQLFVEDPPGRWVLDTKAVDHVAETVARSRYPIVMYLFANHFSVGTKLEELLTRDPANLARLAQGEMTTESYHGAPLYPWSVARVDNALSRYRSEAFDVVVRRLCQRMPAERAPLTAITLLGETHHMFPSFEQGMAFDAPYRISDYSEASMVDFVRYLQQRFPRVVDLNRDTGAMYASHADVVPPGSQLSNGVPQDLFQFIGPFAHGLFPVSGWVHDGRPGAQIRGAKVEVRVDGHHVAQVPAHMSRQDVLAAIRSIATAQVGYHHDVDFREWADGRHRIDVSLLSATGERTNLGTRYVRVQRLGASAVTHGAAVPKGLPEEIVLPDGVRGWLDNPAPETVLSFNPLAELWHAFRQQQVVRYIQFFSDRLNGTCLKSIPRFTHQIFPQANPGWDAQRFAIQSSIGVQPAFNLGISLYGEAAWGESFSHWLRRSGHHRYGVTEFHPLQAMDSARLAQVLAQHQEQGAAFVSYFLETRWSGKLIAPPRNPYAFDPENPHYGSDALYRASLRLDR